MEPRPAVIYGVEQFVLRSPEVGRDFAISVALPPTPLEPGQTLPVLYALDGDNFLGSIIEPTRMFQVGKLIPPCLVVAVGYDGVSSVADWARMRVRELTTPTDEETIALTKAGGGGDFDEHGGADAFVEFLVSTVQPFVRERYTAASDRSVLFGHSFGGLFALHTLFSRTEAFQDYIASSPSIWWGRGSLLKEEARYAETHDDLPARVSVLVGSLEETPGSPLRMVSNVRTLAERLEARRYPSLRFTSRVLEGQTHLTMAQLSLNLGLQDVLVGESIGVPST